MSSSISCSAPKRYGILENHLNSTVSWKNSKIIIKKLIVKTSKIYTYIPRHVGWVTKVRKYESTKVRKYESAKVRKYESTTVTTVREFES